MNVVVGSGPTGAIVAHTLLGRGEAVTLLDIGDRLDPALQARVAELAGRDPRTWTAAERHELGAEALPPPPLPKLRFGSDRPYALQALGDLGQEGTECLLSEARGGLSTVWGAAMLPAVDDDLEDWPSAARDLAPHYRAVGELVGLCATNDDLAKTFPLHATPLAAPELSPAARRILERAGQEAGRLAGQGLVVGAARLAVSPSDTSPHGCRGCGLCLSGCAWGSIWESGHLLDRLQGHPGFEERPGHRVERLVPIPAGVRIEGRKTASGETFTVEAKRVFLAAGPLATARLVIDSCAAHGRTFPLRHQPYFLLPALLSQAAKEDGRGPSALAQLFLEWRDPELSRFFVHLQLYTSSVRLRAELRASLQRLGPAGSLLTRLLGKRVAALQGYLHDREGEPIQLRGEPDGRGRPGRLHLRRSAEAPEHARIRRIVARLGPLARSLGVWPVTPALRLGRPGNGNHVGGVFPMAEDPGPFATDVAGRLRELPGVHLVDAAVLPSLPATTFTYTVMANARRIALEA